MRNALVLELLQDELQRRDFLRIRLAHDDRRIARREHISRIGLELDRARTVEECESITEKFDSGGGRPTLIP